MIYYVIVDSDQVPNFGACDKMPETNSKEQYLEEFTRNAGKNNRTYWAIPENKLLFAPHALEDWV